MSATIDSVPIEVAPVVEIDTEAPAAYIRISHNLVFRTSVLRDDESLVTMDDCATFRLPLPTDGPPRRALQPLLMPTRHLLAPDELTG